MIAAKEVPFDRKMTLGKVLSFTFAKFFKEISAAGQWLLLSLLVVIFNLIPLGLIILSVEVDFGYMQTLGIPVNPLGDVNMPLLITGALIGVAVLIFDIVFSVYTLGWFTRVGLDAFDGNSRGFGERMGLGFKDLWRLGAPFILLTLFGIIVMIPYYITSFINVDPTDFTVPMMITYCLGLGASFYMSIKTSAMYGILLEQPELTVMECFKETFNMTKGRGWRILGYYVSYTATMVFFVFVLMIPILIVWVVAGVSSMNIGVVGFAIVLTILLYMLMLALSTGTAGIMHAGIYKYLLIEHSEAQPEDELPETAEVSQTVETTETAEVSQIEEKNDSDESSDK